MEEKRSPLTYSKADSMLAEMMNGSNVRVLEQSVEISRHVAAIQQLAAITQQVEQPYIASYLSV